MHEATRAAGDRAAGRGPAAGDVRDRLRAWRARATADVGLSRRAGAVARQRPGPGHRRPRRGRGKDPSFAVNPPTAHVTISTLGRGELRAVAGPAGTTAVAFPSVEQSSQGNIAALHAVIDKFSTVFSPDAEDFQFGADVYFSEPPRRATGDDGDNLIQRGLFGEKGQIKLQVDNGVPSCRIAGDQGEALIKGTRLAVGQWYRLRCQRDDDRVSLYVGRIRADGEVTRWALTSTTQPTGLIEFVGNRPAPVSIGGKLNPVGEVVADAPDQFNGALAHIVYDLH
ncbi:MAG: LamG domain-containing protein [Nocardioides sp.]